MNTRRRRDGRRHVILILTPSTRSSLAPKLFVCPLWLACWYLELVRGSIYRLASSYCRLLYSTSTRYRTVQYRRGDPHSLIRASCRQVRNRFQSTGRSTKVSPSCRSNEALLVPRVCHCQCTVRHCSWIRCYSFILPWIHHPPRRAPLQRPPLAETMTTR